MIIDIFPFYNELDLLEYRLKTLYDQVDYFIIIEGDRTHMGSEKPMYFESNKARYEQYMSKIIYHVAKLPVTTEELETYKERVPKVGAVNKGWISENVQRMEALEALKLVPGLQDSDMIIFSDADEIPNMSVLLSSYDPDALVFLLQHLFYQCIHMSYNTSTDRAFITSFKVFKQYSADLLRWRYNIKHPVKYVKDAGWHFSYFGNYKSMSLKLSSFAHQEPHTQRFNNLEYLRDCVKNHKMHNHDNFKYLHPYKVHDDFSNFTGTKPPHLDWCLAHFSYCSEVDKEA